MKMGEPQRVQLVDLPTEIIVQIADTLGHLDAISAFSRTNRHLHRILTPHLYWCSAMRPDTMRLWLPRALHWAARYGREDVMRLALVPYNNTAGEKTGDALLMAAERGHANVVRLLLAMPGVDIKVADMDGRTLLHLAAKGGYPDVVKLLFAVPEVEIEGVSDDGWTPVQLADANGHLDVVRLFVEAGVDEGEVQRYPVYGTRVDRFLRAVREGHFQVVEKVLAESASFGFDANVRQYESGIPMRTKYTGDGVEVTSEVCLYTLARQNVGVPAIHLAAQHGHGKTLEVLLAAGADIEARNGSGETALIYVIERKRPSCLEVAEVLLRRGADVNAVCTETAKTALMSATYSADLVQTMLAIEGVEVNAVTSWGWSALTYAASIGNEDAVEALLQVEDINPWLGCAQQVAKGMGCNRIAKMIEDAQAAKPRNQRRFNWWRLLPYRILGSNDDDY